MITIENVTIIPKYPNRVYAEWSVTNPFLAGHYFFYLTYADGPEGPYLPINTLPLVDTYFHEFEFPLLTKQEYFYFKVHGQLNGVEIPESLPQAFIIKLPLHAWSLIKEIVRKKNLVREKFIGIPSIVRKRKILGQPCTHCLDVATGYITNSHCSICYGTKIIGGYNGGIAAYCEIVEQERGIAPSEIGTIENIMAAGFLTYPLVFKGDVIIENVRNKRWMVNTVARTTFQNYPVEQKIELRQLSPKDIEYSLDSNG